jgi:hypothetical protein
MRVTLAYVLVCFLILTTTDSLVRAYTAAVDADGSLKPLIDVRVGVGSICIVSDNRPVDGKNDVVFIRIDALLRKHFMNATVAIFPMHSWDWAGSMSGLRLVHAMRWSIIIDTLVIRSRMESMVVPVDLADC